MTTYSTMADWRAAGSPTAGISGGSLVRLSPRAVGPHIVVDILRAGPRGALVAWHRVRRDVEREHESRC